MMDWSHAGRIGNWVTVNGGGEFRLPVGQRERLRLRLVNTANARIFTLGLEGMEGWIVALDGQPLDTPAPMPAPRRPDRPRSRTTRRSDRGRHGRDGARALLVSFERERDRIIATLDVGGLARAERLPAPLGTAAQSRSSARRSHGGTEGDAPNGRRGHGWNA